MRSYRSSIYSGETRLLHDYLPEWVADIKDEDFVQFDTLISDTNLCDFLRQLKSIPFYQYMTRYLLSRYPEAARRLAKQTGCDPNDYKEPLAQKIFAEIKGAAPEGSAPLQEEICRLVWADFIKNGFGADSKKGLQVYGDLKNTAAKYRWDLCDLRRVLFAKEIKDHTFFVLALGMQMAIQDVSIFLQKVLLRRPLDLFHPDETILRLCLERGTGNLLQLYRSLLGAYTAAVCGKMPPVKQTLSQLWDTYISPIAPGTLSQATPAVQDWLRHYKAALATPAPHSDLPNQAFLDLYQDLNDVLAPELNAIATDRSPLPCGTVFVSVDPERDLVIPIHTRFCDKDGNAVAVSTAEASTQSWNESLSFEVEVWGTQPVGKDTRSIPKHETFRLVNEQNETILILQNKSAVKAEGTKCRDGSCRQRATLVGTCSSRISVPEGSRFVYSIPAKKAGGTERLVFFENKKPVSLACLSVSVEALPHAAPEEVSFIPKNTLCGTNLPPEEQEKILHISHMPLMRHEKGTEGVSRLIQYLYHPCAASDKEKILGYVAEAFPTAKKEDAMARFLTLVEPILSGTRLTDSRRTQLKQATLPLTKRNELLTLAFLLFSLQFPLPDNPAAAPDPHRALTRLGEKENAEAQVHNMHTFLNHYLEQSGFHPLYYTNPYDRLLQYLSLFEDPFAAYQFLWCIYLTCKQEMEAFHGHTE